MIVDDRHEDSVRSWKDYFGSVDPSVVERRARSVLPESVFDFIAGGADDEVSMDLNTSAFLDYGLRPRILGNIQAVTPSSDAIGVHSSMPIWIAPVGGHGLAHSDGEIASARAAASVGAGFVASTASSIELEVISRELGDSVGAFQLYLFQDGGITDDLLDRAVAAGYKAIVVTVDAPIRGWRKRDMANRFEMPAGVGFASLERYSNARRDLRAGRLPTEMLKKDLSWRDISRVIDRSSVPVAIKGILHPSDARKALEFGVSGLYVSNHGGRQLGRAIPGVYALEEIRNEVGTDMELILDGGIRHAADALVGLGLGASVVCIGRPVLWALALGGERAVRAYLEVLRTQIERTMHLLGCATVGELETTVVRMPLRDRYGVVPS